MITCKMLVITIFINDLRVDVIRQQCECDWPAVGCGGFVQFLLSWPRLASTFFKEIITIFLFFSNFFKI